MPQVKWLAHALADFERLHAFLLEKSPDAAAKAAKTILDGTELLKQAPEAGRPMPDDSERRELFLAFGSGAYVLRYRIENGEIVVIVRVRHSRVWHSRENRTD